MTISVVRTSRLTVCGHSFPPGNIYHTMWDYFIPAFNCPHRIQRVGSLGDGGKWVCGVQRLAAQRAPCVVYSLGVNHDSSFEAALLTAAPNCEVWGYDFSVNSFGPEVHNNPTFAAKSHFAPYKIGAHDNAHLNPPEYTIQTLLERNGHRFIDLLKIDIEGAEFDALTAFLKPYLTPGGPSLPVGQLEIEIHVWGANSNFQFFHHWWSLMEMAGLRPFFTEPNLPHVSHLRTRPDVVEVRSFVSVARVYLLTHSAVFVPQRPRPARTRHRGLLNEMTGRRPAYAAQGRVAGEVHWAAHLDAHSLCCVFSSSCCLKLGLATKHGLRNVHLYYPLVHVSAQ